MKPWITIVGIGDDGIESLTPAARAVIETAELLVGGDRHQAMIAETQAQRLTWTDGLEQAMEAMSAWRGRRAVVLATGDPMWFGAGANLIRRFDPAEMVVLPVPGAFSLAAARMLWPLADVELLTVHGRPLENLIVALYPGARWLVLSRDGETPAAVARLLTEHGYGPSGITVLEHLGGAAERRIEGIAERWTHSPTANLNTLAVECRAGPRARVLARVPGLPDTVFENDGKMTKREVRAATIAALQPVPGQLLWDIGAGSGSVAIEWLRALPHIRVSGQHKSLAVAVERSADRCTAIARNAASLGVPHLEVVHGNAPAVLGGLGRRPDSVFIGGGVTVPGLIEGCWEALSSGGRLVVNAVSIEGEGRLFEWQRQRGGELARIAVARAEPVGSLSAFRPAMGVTQYIGHKP
jgi:precorrin-6Y C5,15-methyltransferase (decarboxylating)